MEILNPKLKYKQVSFAELAAMRKSYNAGLQIDGAGLYGIQATPFGIEVTLGPVSVYKSGPRKGKTKYGARKHCWQVTVSDSDVEAEKKIYSQVTARCTKCYGNGLVWIAWSAAEGSTYKECRDCAGTGLATEKQLGSSYRTDYLLEDPIIMRYEQGAKS